MDSKEFHEKEIKRGVRGNPFVMNANENMRLFSILVPNEEYLAPALELKIIY